LGLIVTIKIVQDYKDRLSACLHVCLAARLLVCTFACPPLYLSCLSLFTCIQSTYPKKATARGSGLLQHLMGNFYLISFLSTLFNTASSAALRVHCVGGCWD
jgi:hypothetical protein